MTRTAPGPRLIKWPHADVFYEKLCELRATKNDVNPAAESQDHQLSSLLAPTLAQYSFSSVPCPVLGHFSLPLGLGFLKS